jgi:tungstate transport system substrate-binding protein
MGVNGEADVLLVHSRAAEDKFMSAGDGIVRYDVMYNDFVLVGPKNDPAGVLNQGNDIVKAMAEIADSKATFISRGDNSGTHTKEKDLWKAANITPEGSWYISAGTGWLRLLWQMKKCIYIEDRELI